MPIRLLQAAVPLLLFISLQSYFHLNGKLQAARILELVAIFGLLLLIFLQTKLKGRYLKRLFTGLMVLWTGMFYFEFFGERFDSFWPTMIFFLVPQLYFLSAFYLDFKSAPALDKSGARIALGFTFLLSVGYYLQIREALGILRMPVLIGVFSTCFLFLMACFRNLRVNKESFWLVLTGVFCYMMAEALLTYHVFVKQVAGGGLIYTVGFFAGLFLIVLGSISRKLLHIEAPVT